MRMTWLVVVSLLAWGSSVRAQGDGGAPPANPRRLLLMVQYVGTDYGNAVQAGKVVDQAEYDEALQNTEDALAAYQRLRPQGPLAEDLGKLKQVVARRGPGTEVRALVESLIPALSSELSLRPFPRRVPDLAAGAAHYQQLCTACHGATGKGDGPAAANLKPPPAAMADPAWADAMAPFQVFNTITLGIPGTGMASFAADLDADARWDVAFYVMTLRAPGSPAQLHPALGVRELAAQSNTALASQLRAQQPSLSAEAALALVDGARRKMPDPLPVPEAMAKMAEAAETAARLAAEGKALEGGALVQDTYMDVVEPVEPELRATRGEEVSRMEGAITALRRVLRDGGDAVAAAALVRTTATALAQPPPPAPEAAPAEPEEPVEDDPPNWRLLALLSAIVTIIATLVARRQR